MRYIMLFSILAVLAGCGGGGGSSSSQTSGVTPPPTSGPTPPTGVTYQLSDINSEWNIKDSTGAVTETVFFNSQGLETGNTNTLYIWEQQGVPQVTQVVLNASNQYVWSEMIHTKYDQFTTTYTGVLDAGKDHITGTTSIVDLHQSSTSPTITTITTSSTFSADINGAVIVAPPLSGFVNTATSTWQIPVPIDSATGGPIWTATIQFGATVGNEDPMISAVLPPLMAGGQSNGTFTWLSNQSEEGVMVDVCGTVHIKLYYSYTNGISQPAWDIIYITGTLSANGQLIVGNCYREQYNNGTGPGTGTWSGTTQFGVTTTSELLSSSNG